MKTEVIKVKQITVHEIKDTDFVGIEYKDGSKGFISYICNGYMPICAHSAKDAKELGVCNVAYNGGTTYKSVKDAALNFTDNYKIFLFDTPSELYQWLAE